MLEGIKLSKYLARYSILGNPERSLSRPIVRISVISISVSVAVMILTVCMVRGFREETRHTLRKFFPDLWIQSAEESFPEWTSVHLSEDSLQELYQRYEGLRINGVIGKTTLLRFHQQNEGAYLKGIDTGHRVFKNLSIVRGRWFRTADAGGIPEMVVSSSLAKSLGLDTGSVVQAYFLIKTQKTDSISRQSYEAFVPKVRKFRISGWYADIETEGLQDIGYTSVEVLRKVNGWKKFQFSCYEVVNHTSLSNVVLSGEVSSWLLYRMQVVPLESRMFNFFVWLDKLDINGWVVILLMGIVCVVNAMMSLLILIIEQVREVGLLKALGMTHGSIRNIFFFVAWHILSRGIGYGVMAGLLFGFLQWKYHWIRLNPQTYYIDHVAIAWDWIGMIKVILIVILFCMLTLLIPTRYIASIRPFRILRYE